MFKQRVQFVLIVSGLNSILYIWLASKSASFLAAALQRLYVRFTDKERSGGIWKKEEEVDCADSLAAGTRRCRWRRDRWRVLGAIEFDPRSFAHQQVHRSLFATNYSSLQHSERVRCWMHLNYRRAVVGHRIAFKNFANLYRNSDGMHNALLATVRYAPIHASPRMVKMSDLITVSNAFWKSSKVWLKLDIARMHCWFFTFVFHKIQTLFQHKPLRYSEAVFNVFVAVPWIWKKWMLWETTSTSLSWRCHCWRG